MSEGMWIALISASGVVGTSLITGLVAVINLIVNQSKSTITAVTEERDYWRSIAESYRAAEQPKGDDG